MVKQGRPKVFLHENVCNFPVSKMAQILGRGSNDFVRGGCSSRWNIFCSLVCACQLWAGPEFAVEAVELDPQFFGFPVRRPRQYAVCILKEAATILGCLL